MAKVVKDPGLQARIENALATLGIGVGELARQLDIPLITLRRVRKSGCAIDSTRHRINCGLRQLGIPDSSVSETRKVKMLENDQLRLQVISALELLLEMVRSGTSMGDRR